MQPSNILNDESYDIETEMLVHLVRVRWALWT